MIKKVKKSEETLIEFCDLTYNPWQGCHKLSLGCRFCYMFRDKMKYGQEPNRVVRSKDPTFYKPLKWHEPKLVFTCSWSDFFISEADAWRDEVWEIIRATPHLTYQIITKRPERILDNLPDDWGDGYPNVWLGVTVENNATRHRLRTLSEIPAAVRFISFEPLLENLDLDGYMQILTQYYGWGILGAESGNDNGLYRYRPCQVEWLEHLVDVCRRTDVAVFVKQLGTHLHNELGLRDRHARDIEEFPESLKIREFPK